MRKVEALLLAVAVTVAVPLGQALLTLNESTFDHPMPFVRSAVIGVAVAIGALMYKWSQAHGPVVTIAKRAQPEDVPGPIPVRQPANSPELPDGWTPTPGAGDAPPTS